MKLSHMFSSVPKEMTELQMPPKINATLHSLCSSRFAMDLLLTQSSLKRVHLAVDNFKLSNIQRINDYIVLILWLNN